MIPKKMPENLQAFYVGSNNLTADWTRATLKEAIEHGNSLVEKSGYDEVFIVKIVKVVRRKTVPAVVEAFKPVKRVRRG